MRSVIYFALLILGAVADIPTEEQRTQIVELLTNVRESVDPPASNMLLMKYSSELETTAQNFLANCSSTGLDQSSLPVDIFDFGNAYNNKGPMYVDMLTFYASDKQYYNYDQNQCTGFCRYYKVMTLATSNAVGCAQNNCTRQGDTFESYLTVCLFKMNGGNTDERPYKRGKSCTECPDGFVCHRKQCIEQVSLVTNSTSSITSISTILSPVSIMNMLLFVLCLNA